MDRSRQVATVAAAAAQVLLPLAWGPKFDRKDVPEVITPAPYAFSVWFPIFAGAIGYAGYQSRPSVGDSALMRRVGWPLAGAFAATGIWAPLARAQRDWSAQVALAGIAAGAELARRRIARAELQGSLSKAELAAVAPVTGLLAAWGLAATGVNLGAMLVGKGLVPAGWPGDLAGVALLGSLGAAGAAASLGSSGATVTSRIYAGTLLWALTGVALGQGRRSRVVTVAAISAAVPTVAGLVRGAKRR